MRLEKWISGLEKRISGLEKQIPGLEKRIPGLEKRISGLEKRISGLEITGRIPGFRLRTTPSIAVKKPRGNRPCDHHKVGNRGQEGT